jgi:hypothetical protein
LFKILPRQALHAKTLGFVHPTTGEMMRFDTELPQDFRTVLKGEDTLKLIYLKKVRVIISSTIKHV